MPRGPRGEKRPVDVNLRAVMVAKIATGELEEKTFSPGNWDTADHPGRWADHGHMTDPGEHAPLVADLPSGVGLLINVVQGLLIHSDWLDTYPVDKELFCAVTRETLPVADRLNVWRLALEPWTRTAGAW